MKLNIIHTKEQLNEQRWETERRHLSFKSLLYSMYKGKRIKPRRQEESKLDYYTDKYETWVGVNVIAIFVLSVLDCFFTLSILARGGIEVNPFMSALLAINTHVFLIGKLVITAVCLAFVLVHVNFHVFKVLPVKYLLLCISIIYIFLINYELFLLSII